MVIPCSTAVQKFSGVIPKRSLDPQKLVQLESRKNDFWFSEYSSSFDPFSNPNSFSLKRSSTNSFVYINAIATACRWHLFNSFRRRRVNIHIISLTRSHAVDDGTSEFLCIDRTVSSTTKSLASCKPLLYRNQVGRVRRENSRRPNTLPTQTRLSTRYKRTTVPDVFTIILYWTKLDLNVYLCASLGTWR